MYVCMYSKYSMKYNVKLRVYGYAYIYMHVYLTLYIHTYIQYVHNVVHPCIHLTSAYSYLMCYLFPKGLSSEKGCVSHLDRREHSKTFSDELDKLKQGIDEVKLSFSEGGILDNNGLQIACSPNELWRYVFRDYVYGTEKMLTGNDWKPYFEEVMNDHLKELLVFSSTCTSYANNNKFPYLIFSHTYCYGRCGRCSVLYQRRNFVIVATATTTATTRLRCLRQDLSLSSTK